MSLNETHAVQCQVASASRTDVDLSIQNLPHRAFRHLASAKSVRGGVAKGDATLDLSAVEAFPMRALSA